jgi:hypothetical protein
VLSLFRGTQSCCFKNKRKNPKEDKKVLDKIKFVRHHLRHSGVTGVLPLFRGTQSCFFDKQKKKISKEEEKFLTKSNSRDITSGVSGLPGCCRCSEEHEKDSWSNQA